MALSSSEDPTEKFPNGLLHLFPHQVYGHTPHHLKVQNWRLHFLYWIHLNARLNPTWRISNNNYNIFQQLSNGVTIPTQCRSQILRIFFWFSVVPMYLLNINSSFAAACLILPLLSWWKKSATTTESCADIMQDGWREHHHQRLTYPLQADETTEGR